MTAIPLSFWRSLHFKDQMIRDDLSLVFIWDQTVLCGYYAKLFVNATILDVQILDLIFGTLEKRYKDLVRPRY